MNDGPTSSIENSSSTEFRRKYLDNPPRNDTYKALKTSVNDPSINFASLRSAYEKGGNLTELQLANLALDVLKRTEAELAEARARIDELETIQGIKKIVPPGNDNGLRLVDSK